MDPEQFNQSLSMLNRDKEQSLIDTVDDTPEESDPLNTSTSSNSFMQNPFMQKVASGVKQMVNKEQQQFEKATEIDTLNPMIQCQAGQVRPPQDKKYCQLCYKELGLLTRKYHCGMCSRTVCGNCSLEEDKQRSCDFCRIKIENGQIDRFY